MILYKINVYEYEVLLDGGKIRVGDIYLCSCLPWLYIAKQLISLAPSTVPYHYHPCFVWINHDIMEVTGY
jgi:hypothetical protein